MKKFLRPFSRAHAQADLSFRCVHRSFNWFCHAAAHLSLVCFNNSFTEILFIIQIFFIPIIGQEDGI